MSFNIEWSGTNLRFASAVDAIQAAGTKIVGVQEAEGNLARPGGDLGWHCNLRNHVISKHALIDPPGANGRYVLAEVLPGIDFVRYGGAATVTGSRLVDAAGAPEVKPCRLWQNGPGDRYDRIAVCEPGHREIGRGDADASRVHPAALRCGAGRHIGRRA